MPIVRDFLKKLGIADEAIDQIMAENGKDIEAHKNALAAKDQELQTAKTENAGFKTQLSERDKDISELKKQVGSSETLNAKITELQTKYDTDTKDLQTKLQGQAYDHAAEKYFEGFKFSSTAAKKAAMADFKAKGLKLVDGKFEGASDFMETLKKEDPAAFIPEDDNSGAGTGNGGLQNPMFTKGMNGQNPPAGNTNPFNFGFSEVRTIKTK